MTVICFGVGILLVFFLVDRGSLGDGLDPRLTEIKPQSPPKSDGVIPYMFHFHERRQFPFAMP